MLLLLVWKTEEPLLISGALGRLMQAMAGINPALTAGELHLLSKGESRLGSRAIPRERGFEGQFPAVMQRRLRRAGR